ncbi:MAG: hypothetical protein ACK4MF_07060 [Hyphomicrobiaceae bacterium]
MPIPAFEMSSTVLGRRPRRTLTVALRLYGVALSAAMVASTAAAQSTATTQGAPYTPTDAAAAEARPVPAAQGAPKDRIGIELNKIEPLANGCRTYLVIDNDGDAAYSALKLDLVLFQSDGVIGRRVALDLAPLRAKKRSVKLFDLDGTKCDDIASLLINDVMDCKMTAAGGAAASDPNCLDRIALKTITKVQISK